jgi:hypothetical protein
MRSFVKQNTTVMEWYNLDKLVKVSLFDFQESNRLKFGRVTSEEDGIYCKFSGKFYKEAPKNTSLKNGVVYNNPKVVFRFEGGFSKTLYFDNLQTAEDFVDAFTTGPQWSTGFWKSN